MSFSSFSGYKFALVTAAGLIGFLAFLGVVRCLRSGGVITTAGRSSNNGENGNSGGNNNSGSGSRGIQSAGLALSGSLLSEDRTPLNAGSPYSVPVSIFKRFASSAQVFLMELHALSPDCEYHNELCRGWLVSWFDMLEIKWRSTIKIFLNGLNWFL